MDGRSAACGAIGCARRLRRRRERSAATASTARASIPNSDGREPELRRRLGLGPGPIFLCVGGVEERKNTLRILDALCAARRPCVPTPSLSIAGGASLLDHGAYQQAFEARLARMGSAAASVHGSGVVADADMPRLYRLASALSSSPR